MKTKLLWALVLFVGVESQSLHAESSELSLLLGTSSVSQGASDKMQSDLYWTQSFYKETWALRVGLRSLSLLSNERSMGYSLSLWPKMLLARNWVGGPFLSLENELWQKKHLLLAGWKMNFELWDLYLETSVNLSLNKLSTGRRFGGRQDVLMPLTQDNESLSAVGVFICFEESLGQGSTLWEQSKTRSFGIVFTTSYSDLF